MSRIDPVVLVLAGALALVAGAPGHAQTAPMPERVQSPPDLAVALPRQDPDVELADPVAAAQYEKGLEAWSADYSDWLDMNAVALAYSIPEEVERLYILNTSTTDVTCAVHRAGAPTGRTLQIPSASAAHIDGIPPGTTDVSLMAAYVPISQIQLRCPQVAGNAPHGNFRVGGRYVIQRAANGGLVLVEVAP